MSATGSLGERGTTLVEALVVVAVLSLVTLIQFPRIQQALRLAWRGQTVAAVAARLKETRADALLNSQTRTFAVAADGSAFTATGYPRAGVPAGVSLSSGGHRPIVFFADGSSSGGDVVIASGGRRSTVSVSDAGAVEAGSR